MLILFRSFHSTVFLPRVSHGLVITGKGRSKGSEGILRRMVPIWLNQPELKILVSGWDEASIHHGGAGALYVRLKNAQSGLNDTIW